MTFLDLQKVREEITYFLRSADILTTAVRGVTRRTDTYTATAGQVAFTLTQTPVKNIKSLVVNSVTKTLYKDYTFVESTGVVTLNTGALVGEAVSIQYDYGSADKIFPDHPRADLTLNSFPRISIETTSSTSENLGLGGVTYITDVLVTIYCFVPVNKDSSVASGFGGQQDLSTLLNTARHALVDGCKGFYYFPYIKPTSTGPIIVGQDNKIIQQNQDFRARFIVEN